MWKAGAAASEPSKKERPPAARRPVPPAGSTAAGWATDRQHARSPPENARAPVGLPVGGGERGPPAGGGGAHEGRPPRVRRGRFRQGLGDRGGPGGPLPGQPFPASSSVSNILF